MCDVSVIIVNWNTCSHLKACLVSLQSSGCSLDYEIIVVDNASSDGSIEMVQNEFGFVRLICNQVNEGFGKANNQAISIAKGRHLLFINSDVIVSEKVIDQIIAYADHRHDAGAIGCNILNTDMTLQRSCYLFPSALNLFFASLFLNHIFPKSRLFGREQFTWWDFAQEKEVDLVKGCFMLIPHRVIQEVGMFDEHFFMFSEEADLCCRIRQAGYKVLYYPSVRVVHCGQASVKKSPIEMKLVMMGSRLLFIRKYDSVGCYYIACFCASLFFLVRAPFFLFKGIFIKRHRLENIKKANMYLWAMVQVLINSSRLREVRPTPP